MKKLLPVILVLLFVLVLHAFADLERGWDAFYKKDYATALKEWKPLAEGGDADAQVNLGDLYSIGFGVPKDKTEAVKWYRLAAEQGHARAQTNLGVMYDKGHGVPEDDVYAYTWFNIASSLGNKNATENKQRVERWMSRHQVEEAQVLSRKCLNSNYEDCK